MNPRRVEIARQGHLTLGVDCGPFKHPRWRRCLPALVICLSLGVPVGCDGGGTTGPKPLPVASVVITPGVDTLFSAGETLQLFAVARSAEGNVISGKNFSWISSDESILAVNGSGLVTASGPNGLAVITATADGVDGTATIDVVTGAVGGTVIAEEGKVVLEVPAEAVLEPVTITVEPVTEYPAQDRVVAGAVYDFGPDGTQFETPVQLTIGYDASELPEGVSEEEIRLQKLIGTTWVTVEGSTVDLSAKTVGGAVSGFSVFGVAIVPQITVTALCILGTGSYPILVNPPPIPYYNGSRTYGVFDEHGVSTLWLTSTLFNAIIDEAPECLAHVEELLVGGEALSPAHVARAQEALPGVQLINGYGPTEATAFSCTYTLPRRDWAKERSIPIGRPISQSTAYILDSAGRICPVGVPGELHVGGDGVARGYVGDPELTATLFVPDPFSDDPHSRLYKTGDRCRYLEGGLIEYLGRNDHQVKIRGFRIEPIEIETVLARHPDVKETVVTASEIGSPGGAYLVAYVVPDPDGRVPAVEELKEHLQGELPAYMVPSVFVMMEELPLTEAGKVARRRLPVPTPPQAA
ncbi:AMP-binding protein, partial [Gemmatimonadota bacterium]